ncbi:MAG: HEAT repeat domain-containing protein [Deltaproteobacteria bacterium]|nr:HEAT repeat domain-containing protein [Deltaproteobacteria bacterium]
MIADDIASALRAAADGDGETRWDHVRALHRDGTVGALHAAVDLCESSLAEERRLGADILGQLGGSGDESPHRAHSAPILAGLLHDPCADVVDAAVVALGHLAVEVDPSLLASLAAPPAAEVRCGVAWALPNIGGAVTSPVLIQLSQDPDDDVRDWATFGLGSMIDDDSPQIRDALFARTSDAHDETRGESLVGLAIRHDTRVLDPLLRELRADSVSWLAVDAARELGAPELLGALEELLPWWDVDRALVEEAIAACGHERPPRSG